MAGGSVCVWSSGVCLRVCAVFGRGVSDDVRASPIAQLVERAAVNLKVAGSNPAGRASFTHITLAQSLERTTKYDQ